MTSIVKETVIEVSETKIQREVQIDSLGRSYATGKRKNSIARVWIKKGKGKITVNGKNIQDYFGREILSVIAKQPLVATKNDNKFDIVATATGGGLSGQAGAILLGISKALVLFDPTNHTTLRQGGFLTRDSRVVERKKYGLKKARKGKTYRKR